MRSTHEMCDSNTRGPGNGGLPKDPYVVQPDTVADFLLRPGGNAPCTWQVCFGICGFFSQGYEAFSAVMWTML